MHAIKKKEGKLGVDVRTFEFEKFLKTDIDESKILGTINKRKSILFLPLGFPSEYYGKFHLVESVKRKEINSEVLKWDISFEESSKKYEVSCLYDVSRSEYEKYLSKDFKILTETKEEYQNITKPFLIERGELGKTDWIEEKFRKVENNIDDGTLLYAAPDNEWILTRNNWAWKDESNIQDLNCLVFFKDKNLTSLRDLNDKHLDLLKEVEKKVKKIILETYKDFKISEYDLRFFFHYLPSYYRLHLHITHAMRFIGSNCERARTLGDVIDNIEMKANYYQEKKMSIQLPEHSELFRRLIENKKKC